MSVDENRTSIDELLDRAVQACNRGDRATAATLAEQVLAVDSGNADAEDLLAVSDQYGEIRRLTLMFVDLVDSTALSTRVEPETYHAVVGRYRQEVLRLVNHYEGHISSTKGDGLLAVFGHPKAHDNDVRRAVAAGLDIVHAVARLSEHATRQYGVTIDVRVGVHRGIVYLDTSQDDVFGFAANLAARISSLAAPGTVAISETVAALIEGTFELTECPPAPVKGVDGLVNHHRVVAERPFTTPRAAMPLIGRVREQSWLQHAWELTQAGESTCPGVAFRGEPGIGKTRLARTAADIVERSGAIVVELRGSPLHHDSGLHPVRRLIERRCGITRLTDAAQRLRLLHDELHSLAMDSAAAIPLLAPVLGIGPEHGYQPSVTEGRTLYDLIGATVHRYLLACLKGRPGLIIAEDMHWFDPSSMDLVDSLLTKADGRLLMVLTGREGKWLQSQWPVELFELTALTPDESDALIDALDPDLDDAQRTAVRDRCDGVPFYIEHVLNALDATADKHQVPEALYEPLFAQLHTRPHVVPVIEAAAVIGRSGDLALLRAVTGTGTDTDSVVAELVEAQVFEATEPEQWRFRHELFREVASELAPPSLQRDLHARVAHELVEAATDVQPDWPLVASHYANAHQYDKAVTANQRACTDARRRGAPVEACAHLSTALRQLDRCTPNTTRDRTEVALRLERGFLIGATHGSMSGDGPADFERCLELSSSGPYLDELFATLTAMLSYYVPRAELRRSHELLDSLSGLITRDQPWLDSAIASSLGSITWLEGDFGAARDHLLRALADSAAVDPRQLDATWLGNTDPISGAHTYLALTHLISGDLAGARADLAESVRRCESLGFPLNVFNRAHTYFKQIWVCLEAGQLDEAAVLAAEMRRCTEDSGLDLWRFVSATEHATVKATLALRDGAYPEALAAAADNIAIRIDASRSMHLNVYLTFHDSIIARLLISAGQPDRARVRLDAALHLAEESGMHFHDAELMRLRARTFTDRSGARDGLTEALACARRQGSVLFELRCLLESFDLFGDGDRDALADAVERFGAHPEWPERVRAERIMSLSR
ncbi:adenylate/guanylate cyclase domain-containing protein [Mycolicibacterium sp. 050232]|uniref:ATP-binding protein n=1 Tax=Mycolicibacterium sp. 050232 TaxID=3113982 RepID=UPI002E2BF34C|nr:adenylate/guanylate cyclase domain-containing protein [Mycolicibacterium sp. 050232]MED5810924.1 adenylate/guanylate cyclase domain-containing protein [Mycolicibacterium sp. 050232]